MLRSSPSVIPSLIEEKNTIELLEYIVECVSIDGPCKLASGRSEPFTANLVLLPQLMQAALCRG
jgi:hypothetical protein